MAIGGHEMKYSEIKKGDSLPEFRAHMDRETYFAYNKLVNNWNPIHADKDYAVKLGYKDIVVAGLYTYSFITRMVEEWTAPSGTIRSVEVKYHDPVYIDSTMVQRGRVAGKMNSGKQGSVEVEIKAEDGEGLLLISASITVDFRD